MNTFLLLQAFDAYTAEAYPLGDCTIYYVSEKKVESDLKENPTDEITSAALQQNSDLVPNVYEGTLNILFFYSFIHLLIQI